MPRKIFISAVSGELKSYRLVVDQTLRKRGYDPVFQELFGLGDEQIVELLRRKVAECDAVICLIGRRYGAEPSQPSPEFGRRSFTQLEYFLAKASVPPKPCYLFCTTDQTPVDGASTESDELQRLQQTYRDDVTRDRNWRSFDSAVHLRAEIAELRFPWKDDPPQHKPCNLPASIGRLFQGRDDALQALGEQLNSADGKAAVITPRHAIHGLGGIGKTQLAIEYGWQNREKFNALLYVVADTPTSLLTNLAQLSGVLELPEQGLQDDNDRRKAVVRWLVDHPGWYLLIDNVDTPEGVEAVSNLLDELRGGKIVITTRLANWNHLVEPLELDVLAYEDAAKLLLDSSPQRAKQVDDEAQALALANELDGLALAVTQAAGYVNHYRIALAEYAKRLHAETANVLDWYDPKRMKYPKSVAVTWNTTFDRLSDAARMLLEMLSWLSTEPIPRDLLTNAKVTDTWKSFGIERTEEAVIELADVSLVHLEGASLRIHRLVQETTRGRCDDAKNGVSLLAMLKVVDRYPLGNPTDVRNWNRWEPLVAHVAAVADRGDAHSIATPTSKLMNQAALYWVERIRFSDAERLYRRALAIDERYHGADHPSVAIRLNNLAQLLKATNRLSEAEQLMCRALTNDERSYGPDHPKVAIRLNNLAQLLKATNRHSEAEPLIRRALAIDERSYGPDHPDVARVLNNLSLLLKATSRLSEAEPLMRRALAIDEGSLGPDHPDVARDLNNLASLLKATNRLSEAEPLMRRALVIDEGSLGPDHPEVATDLNNLAQLLKATNRLWEAEPLTARSVEIFLKFRAATGHEHPYERAVIRNYIGLLIGLQRTPEQLVAVQGEWSDRFGVPIDLNRILSEE